MCETRKERKIGFGSDMTRIIAQQIERAPGPARRAPGPVLPGEFVLRDGTPALIWPQLPNDAGTLHDVFRRLSPESRRHRFLQALDELDDQMIRRLVDGVDGVQHIALLLIVLPPGGQEEPAGVARILQDRDDPAIADIAVTVVDDWQRRGAGTALVEALMERRPAAVMQLRTVIDAGNRASLALLAKAGHVSLSLPEQGVMDVTVDLPPVSQARTAAETVTWLWARATRKLINETPLVPWYRPPGLVPAVAGYLEFMQRMAEINRDLTVKWAEAASAPFGVVCDRGPSKPAADMTSKPENRPVRASCPSDVEAVLSAAHRGHEPLDVIR